MKPQGLAFSRVQTAEEVAFRADSRGSAASRLHVALHRVNVVGHIELPEID